jgi:hypothetical protein
MEGSSYPSVGEDLIDAQISHNPQNKTCCLLPEENLVSVVVATNGPICCNDGTIICCNNDTMTWFWLHHLYTLALVDLVDLSNKKFYKTLERQNFAKASQYN